jgi:hypothetical protein
MPNKNRMIPRAERFPLHRPIYYRPSESSDWLEGTTENISRTGIIFTAEEDFKPSRLLDIRVSFPLNMTLSCLGAVVRTDNSNGRNALAVQIRRYSLRSDEKRAAEFSHREH